MSPRTQLLRDGLVVVAMTGASFFGGWWSYGYGFTKSRRSSFDFARPYRIPSGYESCGSSPTPETSSFLIGDRIDIYVEEGSNLSPLIIDAIVTDQTKSNFGLLLPHGGRDLLIYARDSGRRLIYRHSIAPADVIDLEAYER